MKFCFLYLFLIAIVSELYSEPVSLQIKDARDYKILDRFFRIMTSEEEYGFVLEGAKPISIRDFYSLDNFFVYHDFEYAEKEFSQRLFIQEVVPTWNKNCSQQKNFVLKTIPIKDTGVSPVYEMQFINISVLRETINKNIDLFRYILGPTTDTEKLINKIAYSEEPLFDILKNDLVLVGIVLGFGTHNSLVGGRSETIDANIISKDCAPFLSKSHLMQSKKHEIYRPKSYGGYFIDVAGGDNDQMLRKKLSILRPSIGFFNLEEELSALNSLWEPIPEALYQRPGFVFGAFKGGPSNQPFFERLLKEQKKIQDLLQEPDFLERVLEKIGGEKPVITCDKSHSTGSLFSLLKNKANAQEWTRIVRATANQFEKEEQPSFFKAFCHPTLSTREAPEAIGYSKATLRGIKKTLSNLEIANARFEVHAKNESLQKIADKQLYYKTTAEGSGKQLKGENSVRIGYFIEDPEGNILVANYDTWLNLSDTIPGFAHGVQGMKVGEKRTIYAHPAIAYGALTTLPPCTDLVIKAHLIDFEENSSGTLPSLTPFDFSWLQDPEYYSTIEKSVQQKPSFYGSFYRDMLDKVEGLDKTAIIAELDEGIREVHVR